MKLISPKFLEEISHDVEKRRRIFDKLFMQKDIFDLVMEVKGIGFEEAISWICHSALNMMQVPDASPSEIKLMRIAAKNFIEEMKDEKKYVK